MNMNHLRRIGSDVIAIEFNGDIAQLYVEHNGMRYAFGRPSTRGEVKPFLWRLMTWSRGQAIADEMTASDIEGILNLTKF